MNVFWNKLFHRIKEIFDLSSGVRASSLVEVMVAMALSAAMSMAILKVNDNSQRSMNKLETDAALKKYHFGSIVSKLSQAENCKESFNSTIVADATTNTTITVLKEYPSVSASNVSTAFVTAGDTVAEFKWILSSMELQAFVPMESGSILGNCNLKVIYERKSKLSFGAKVLTKDVNLYCEINGDNQIINCNSITGEGDSFWDRVQLSAPVMTFIKYNESVRSERIVIGPYDSTNVNPPSAPITISNKEKNWFLPIFTSGVAIPKDGVFSFFDQTVTDVASQDGQWGISEVGISATDSPDPSEIGHTSCLNFLGHNDVDNAIYPYVRHCRKDDAINFVSPNSDKDVTWYRNTVNILKGHLELPYGNFTMSTGSVAALVDTTPFAAQEVTNSFALGPSSDGLVDVTKFGSGVIGAANKNYAIYSYVLGKGNTINPLNTLSDFQQFDQLNIIGESNIFSAETFPGAAPPHNSNIIGFQNTVQCSMCDVFGEMNILEDSTYNNTVVGTYNAITKHAGPNNVLFGFKNVATTSNSTLIGYNNYIDSNVNNNALFEKGAMLISAHGIGPNDKDSYFATAPYQMGFHAENGFRFFTGIKSTSNIQGNIAETVRISPWGTFLHGGWSNSYFLASTGSNNSVIASFESKSHANFSTVVASENSVIENDNNGAEVSLNVIFGGKNNYLDAYQANGIYSSYESRITDDAPTYESVNNVIIGSFGSKLISVAGGNAIIGSKNTDIYGAITNSGIIASENASIVKDSNYIREMYDNLILSSKDILLASYRLETPATSYTTSSSRNAIIGSTANETRTLNSWSNFVGGHDNFLLNTRNVEYEHIGNNAFINSRDTDVQGPFNRSAYYGNVFINSDTQETFKGYGGYNLMINPTGVNLDNNIDNHKFGMMVMSGGDSTTIESDRTLNMNSDQDSNKLVWRYDNGYYMWRDDGHYTYLQAGSSSWATSSDRNLKKNIRSINDDIFMKKFVNLPIQSWEWKEDKILNADGNTLIGIGPFAQDFKKAFDLGSSDVMLSNIDLSGVALKAGKVLDRKTASESKSVISLFSKVKSLLQDVINLLSDVKSLVTNYFSTSHELSNNLKNKMKLIKNKKLLIDEKLLSIKQSESKGAVKK